MSLGLYRVGMDARRLLARHGDAVIAVVTALVYVVELAAIEPADKAFAIPLGLVASLSLLWRRRLPLAVFATAM